MKEKEVESRKCRCRKYCRIYHVKHNWKRSHSELILEKLRALDLCKSCDKTFLDYDNLKKHMKCFHEPNNEELVRRESENGEIGPAELQGGDC